MKIRGHGNGIAIALAGLAVVLAMSGTAYAVTITTVNIADPGTPSRKAKVDGAGRLETVGPTSTIDTVSNFGFDSILPLTSATTAQLAVTTVSYSDPLLNNQFSGSTLSVSLVKITAGTTGQCTVGTDGAVIERYLSSTLVDPGDDIVRTYAAPLLVKPTGSAKYCLGLLVGHVGGSQTSLYLSTVQLTAYAASGTYTGLGTATSAGAATPPSPVLRRK